MSRHYNNELFDAHDRIEDLEKSVTGLLAIVGRFDKAHMLMASEKQVIEQAIEIMKGMV